MIAAAATVPMLASFLKATREEKGLSLREVSARSAELGESLPFATLARIERGEVEPRISKLSTLLRIYEIPAAAVAEYLEFDEIAGAAGEGDLPETIRELWPLAVEAFKRGDNARGAQVAQRVLAYDPLDHELDDYHTGLRAIAIGAWGCGRNRIARSALERLLLDEAHLGRENLLGALIMLGHLWTQNHGFQLALSFLHRAQDLITKKDEPFFSALVHHNLANTFVRMGDADSATRSLELAAPIYEQKGDVNNLCNLVLLRAMVARLQGDGEAAVRLAREALEMAETHSELEGLLAERHCDLGRELLLSKAPPEETLRHLEAALSKAIELRSPPDRFYAHYYLYRFFEERGERERAELELRNAQHFVTKLEERTPEAEHVRALSREERARGATRDSAQRKGKVERRRSRHRARRNERAGA